MGRALERWLGRAAARVIAPSPEIRELLVADGWTVLRFTWEDVMFRPEWVREVLVRAVGVDARTLDRRAWPVAA